jgi:hypothetical protein
VEEGERISSSWCLSEADRAFVPLHEEIGSVEICSPDSGRMTSAKGGKGDDSEKQMMAFESKNYHKKWLQTLVS